MADETDQPNHSTGSMLALYPPPTLAGDLAIPDGLPVTELHLTVAYTGKAAGVDAEVLTAAATALARRAPITGTISGHARFTGGEQDVIVALVDSPALEELRRDTLDQLTNRGIVVPRDHGYTPHITLAYLDPDAPDPVTRLPAVPVEFAVITAVHGDDRVDAPLAATTESGSSVVPGARDAYAVGWALSGGPMTDRVRAGCIAAVRLAAEHVDDPSILEVTLHLGRLEGTWAKVYERRERLIAGHTATVTTAWKNIVADLDARKLITRYCAATYMTSGPAESTDPMLKIPRDEARATALGYLNGIHAADGYPALQAAAADALRAGRAEGMTAGKYIHQMHAARESLTEDGPDWNGDFEDYLDQIELLDDWPALADKWIQDLVGGAATDLGNLLAAMNRDGASYDDMLNAAMDLLGSGDVRAVSTLLDYAMSDAVTQGTADLYASEGVRQYDVLTAGDSRVCAACEQAEEHNPYPITASPPVPKHPGCRCAIAPTTTPFDPATAAPTD